MRITDRRTEKAVPLGHLAPSDVCEGFDSGDRYMVVERSGAALRYRTTVLRLSEDPKERLTVELFNDTRVRLLNAHLTIED
ncbi:MAG TPA: hypothetical protein VM182_10310 [Terriglobia bacterium]|nr:hypothetical protein [Terriglobia bacterium]